MEEEGERNTISDKKQQSYIYDPLRSLKNPNRSQEVRRSISTGTDLCDIYVRCSVNLATYIRLIYFGYNI